MNAFRHICCAKMVWTIPNMMSLVGDGLTIPVLVPLWLRRVSRSRIVQLAVPLRIWGQVIMQGWLIGTKPIQGEQRSVFGSKRVT